MEHTSTWIKMLMEHAQELGPEYEAWFSYRINFLYDRKVCKWVQLLRERHCADLERQDDPDFPYYYSHEAADHAVAFFDNLSHSKGEWAGKTFELEPYQEFDIVRPFFGWLKKETNTRRFITLWVEVGKKNGKSTLGAGLGLLLLTGDNEAGAEVYSAATKLDQAKLIHDEATKMARKSKQLNQHIVIVKNNISVPLLGSKYEPISGDSDGIDGINPHAALADEIHRWKDRDLWDVLEQSMATRREPVLAAFTTAGTGRTSFCYQQRDYMLKVLQGIIEDDTVYPFIATLDGYDEADPEHKDNPFDPEVWVKANPSIGTVLKYSELKKQSEKAQSSVAQLNSFMRYRMNVWTEQAIRWLSMEKWDKCHGDWDIDSEGLLNLDDMIGKPCYGGLDMATTVDIAAFVLVFPWGSKFRILPYFFLPEETMNERYKRDKVPYPQWANDGLIEVTPGDAIDYNFVRDRIIELSSVFDIREVAFDPHNAIATAQDLERAKINMIQHRQSFGAMNAPSKALEIKLINGGIEHGGNRVLRWMASNVTAERDHQDNIMPSKKKSSEKIDGIVATIMGLNRAMLGGSAASVYETRGLISLEEK